MTTDKKKPPQVPSAATPAPATEPSRTPIVIRLDTVEPEKVEHLDDGRFALRKTTMMIGDPGSGKTHLGLSVAANITQGRPIFPKQLSPNSHHREPGNVVAFVGEDGIGDTIRPRFDALDGDASRFHVVKGVATKDANGETHELEIDLSDVKVIEGILEEHRPLLVMIDPIQLYLPANADMNKANEVRRALNGIAKLAERFNACLLLIGHMNKSGTGKAIYRGLGSVDFSAIARSVLVVGEQDGVRAIAHAKANLSAKAPTLTYKLVDGTIEWIGTSTATADDLTAAPIPTPGGRKQEEAIGWLEAKLGDGPMKVTELVALASEAGITERTLRRAKDDLKAKSRRKGSLGTESHWYWMLERDE